MSDNGQLASAVAVGVIELKSQGEKPDGDIVASVGPEDSTMTLQAVDISVFLRSLVRCRMADMRWRGYDCLRASRRGERRRLKH